jgi:hypothetical protein
MDWAEACRILGVPESATDAEIKEQYIYKAQLLHPDKNQDKPENIRQKAEAELALVNQAYAFLSNVNNNPYKIPPKLAVEPMGIRFKDVKIGEKKSTTLIIRNTGGPYTSIWIDNQPAPWLAVTGVKSLTGERLPLEVTLESTGFGEPGSQYSCILSIKLENEKTHSIDQVAIKIELYIHSDAAKVVTPQDDQTSGIKSGAGDLQSKPVSQPESKKKRGFSIGTFLFNLLAFAVIGVVLVYFIRIFFYTFLEFYEMALIIGLIIYSVIAFGLSFNQGFNVSSKPKNRNNKTGLHN